MIDTIVLRIHNIEKYDALINTLHTKKKGAVTQAYVDEQTGEVLEDSYLHSTIYHDSGILVRSSHRSSYIIPSSHYSVSYLVDYRQKYIDINFSIPKAKYSTNVLQFINYFEQDCVTEFRLLMEYIRTFMRQFSPICLISDKDIEINRIDLCYNQFFQTREAALNYLDYQKTLIAQYAQKEGNQMRSFETSLMYKTHRYSFKIYHKGTEFNKNDYNELLKHNPLGFDLHNLYNISDRILRYECTYRNSYLNYAFEQLYHGGKCKLPNVYKYLFRALRMDGTTAKNFRNKKFFLVSEYDKWKSYKDLLGIDWPKSFKGDQNVTFDLTLFQWLFRHFWDYVDRFQVKTSASVDVLHERVKVFNDEKIVRNGFAKRKISLRNERRILMYALLSQSVNLKQLYRKEVISHAQYYRIIKDLKKMGLSEYNPDMNVPKVTTDYQEYKYYFGNYHQ